MSFEREFNAAFEGAERTVFLDLLKAKPQMSLADLAKLTKGRFASLAAQITVGELMGLEGGAPSGRGGARPGRRKVAPVAAGGVNTRTPAGRDAYDVAVLEAVTKSEGPVSAPEVRAVAGGSELQVRKALNRLIDLSKVTFTGKARGTRYQSV